MASVLDSVNQLTQIVGQNRLELLLFSLAGRTERFGVNVFKVREVLLCPKLTAMPRLHSAVVGVSYIRGQTISVIDLSYAIGGKRTENIDRCYVIVAEYSRSVQGFLVSGVERIVNINWDKVMPPPQGMGKNNYLTAITEIDGGIVEILDLEKILDVICPNAMEVSKEIIQESVTHNERQEQLAVESGAEPIKRKILIADDSSVARKQVEKTVTSLGYEVVKAKNGLEAYNILKEYAAKGKLTDQIGLIISDIEMPEMDGYTLSAKIRSEPDLAQIKVILHTSLSGVFNQSLVKKVGADNFVAKYKPDELAKAIKDLMAVYDR
ncbi:MAG: chemotaxis protein CheV [Ruminobacter sp.]|nr:chemotaxis protein CheV [Ruminobacter sp.]